MSAGSPGFNSLVPAIAITLAATAVAGPVRAQNGDSVVRAEALFREGRDAMRRRSYVEACDKFRASNSLDPSPGTQLNWALCDEQAGHLVQALEHARWALDRVGADDMRRPVAAQLAADLERRIPRLSIRLALPSATVSLDGEPLPMHGTEQTRVVDPGSHVIVVDAPAHETASVVVRLGEGESTARTVFAGPPRRAEGATSRELAPSTKRGAARPIGYVLGASALANFAAAALLGGLALGQEGVVDRHCPAKQCDQEGFDAAQRARAFVNASALTFTLGVAGATGAAVLLWTQKATTAASVVAFPGGAGLALRAGF
jgi:hypothetical protein